MLVGVGLEMHEGRSGIVSRIAVRWVIPIRALPDGYRSTAFGRLNGSSARKVRMPGIAAVRSSGALQRIGAYGVSCRAGHVTGLRQVFRIRYVGL